ncbi:MAG TPA: histidine kinase dimerization/phospho-acceptor domain-containing protein [Isosphaeraceae bacterium]
MQPQSANHDCLAGGGEMGALMRAVDWSTTPIGPVESWSLALRTMVRVLLANRFQLFLWWGPRYVQFYNDASRPILGAKHPRSMGQPAAECWSEIWHVIGPLIETPFHGGPASWSEDIFLEMNRYGYVEETHFTIAYSPVPDDDAQRVIGGVLGTVHEITGKVVGERRVAVLRGLGTHAAEAKTAEEACAIAAGTLSAHDRDVPFALIYLLDADGRSVTLAAASGVAEGESIGPPAMELEGAGDAGWPLAEVVEDGAPRVVDGLSARFGAVPPGPWSDLPTSAVVLPIPSTRAHRPAGLLVSGVSARLRLDDQYRGFLDLVAGQIGTAVANARAYEEERKRAEALAELDRAKTAFFSNVSHEFRTPLTLILGPVEDALADRDSPLPAAQRERLEATHRSSLRLLKLVNTLLDFSRIEAGRVQAAYEPTDLATLTAELASNFRSACEKAGVRLVVDCPTLQEPIYVDRDMW